MTYGDESYSLPAKTSQNLTLTWTSSDTTIAEVSALGVVTGKAAGTAIITATTTDGSFTDVSAVTVTA